MSRYPAVLVYDGLNVQILNQRQDESLLRSRICHKLIVCQGSLDRWAANQAWREYHRECSGRHCRVRGDGVMDEGLKADEGNQHIRVVAVTGHLQADHKDQDSSIQLRQSRNSAAIVASAAAKHAYLLTPHLTASPSATATHVL